MKTQSLSRRSYAMRSIATSWEEIWEAGPFYDRISDKLEEAQEFAIFVGWQIDSRLPMKSPDLGGETFKQKILRLCDQKPGFHFYFLIWDHAYLYVLERERWQGRVWDRIHPRVHFIFDNRHLFGGSHHEKLCVIDGNVAFCGGIDLCGERWDTPEHLEKHPSRKHGPYHDVGVQVEGPVCREIQRHIAERWRLICEIPFPDPPAPRGDPGFFRGHRVYLSRTEVPIEATERSPRLVREVEFLFRDLILSARKRLILEGQYYWSRKFNDLLIYKMHEMRHRDFELVIVLTDLEKIRSLTRKMAKYQLELLQRLKTAASATGTRLRLGSPRAFPSRPIYIHSKLLLIDDRFISVGSANFASRAMRLDTEFHLTYEARTRSEREHVETVAQWVLRHWGIPPFLPDRTPARKSLYPLHSAREVSLGQRFHWEYFFDPDAPWTYLLKRKFMHRLRLTHDPPFAPILFFWLGFCWLTLPWLRFFSIALSAIGWVRLPFLGILAILSWTQGTILTQKIALFSIWTGGVASYLLARLLPSTARRVLPGNKTEKQIARLGNRSLLALIQTLLDPRISIHSKIVYQGLYFLPLPWFILGTGVILPALVSLWIKCAGFFLKELGPPPPFLNRILEVGLAAYLIIRVMWEFFDGTTGKTEAPSERPLL